MPHSSGQRHGDFRYRTEMAHSVSPFLIVYRSGAPGASSDRGTPCVATFSAVWRWSSVTGNRDCWPHAGPTRATISSETISHASKEPLFHTIPSSGRPMAAGAETGKFVMLKASVGGEGPLKLSAQTLDIAMDPAGCLPPGRTLSGASIALRQPGKR